MGSARVGSFEPLHASPTQVFMAATAAERDVALARSDALEAACRYDDLKDVAHFLTDLRKLHEILFEGLCKDLPQAVGTFRGTPDTALAHAAREVRVRNADAQTRAKDACAPPEAVPQRMAVLHRDLQRLVQSNKRIAPIDAMAALTFEFFDIHPFLDGNGHVWRAGLIVLARHLGMMPVTAWRVGERPYDVAFSRAIQAYPTQPDLLCAALGRFFEPVPERSS